MRAIYLDCAVDDILPLIQVCVPVQLTHAARMQLHQGPRHVLGDGKALHVCHNHPASL